MSTVLDSLMEAVDGAIKRSEELACDLVRMAEGKRKGESLYAFAISLVALSQSTGVTREGFIAGLTHLWDEMAERLPHVEKGQA